MMAALKIDVILLFIVSAFFELHADIPEESVFAANEQEILEVTCDLKSPQKMWLLMPTEKSFENEVIQKMASNPHWHALRAWQPPNFDGYVYIVAEKGLTVLHQEPQRILLEGSTLRQWVETELVPKLKLECWEVKEFADEFLYQYGHDIAVCRQLLVHVGCQ